MAGRRAERVADLIRSELSSLLLLAVKDPRVKLACITQVAVSADLTHAVVRVSVLGDEAAREQCLLGLASAGGFLRQKLGAQLRMRSIPELEFRLDRGAEHSQRISQILEDL